MNVFISTCPVPYHKALAQQRQLHASALATGEPSVWLLEHSPTISLGKHANPSHVTAPAEFLAQQGIEVVQSDRGGNVTVHMPGQLVAYYFFPLKALGVKAFVAKVEASVTMLLARFDVQAVLNPGCPGVWADGAKIASVGLRISQQVSSHGMALNICNALDVFQAVIPCGMKDCRVIRLNDLIAVPIKSVDEVYATYIE